MLNKGKCKIISKFQSKLRCDTQNNLSLYQGFSTKNCFKIIERATDLKENASLDPLLLPSYRVHCFDLIPLVTLQFESIMAKPLRT